MGCLFSDSRVARLQVVRLYVVRVINNGFIFYLFFLFLFFDVCFLDFCVRWVCDVGELNAPLCLNKYNLYTIVSLRLNAALSSATQHAMSQEFGKWGTVVS